MSGGIQQALLQNLGGLLNISQIEDRTPNHAFVWTAGGAPTSAFIVNANIAAGANIAQSKLVLAVTNTEIAAGADIALNKIGGDVAAGDLIKRNATEWARLARGTALQVLRVNAGATDLEYATAEAWQVLGTDELTVAGQTLSITGMAARRYLKILFLAKSNSNTIQPFLRFNNDSGNNYNWVYSGSIGGAQALLGSELRFSGASSVDMFISIDVMNEDDENKVCNALFMGFRILAITMHAAGEWENNAQVTRVDVLTSSDMQIGSRIVVLGHD